MHFNVKNAYKRLFPSIDLSKDELSLDDMIIIATFIDSNLNFNSEKVRKFLLSIDRDFKGVDFYRKSIRKFVNPEENKGGSIAKVSYWINRGWSEKEAKEKISKSQRERSKICPEYWIKRGYTEEQAKNKITEQQKKCAKSSNKVFNVDYWLSEGLNQTEAEERVKEATKKRSSWTIDFWLERGFSEEEAKNKVSDLYRNTAKDVLVKKHGVTEGMKKWESIQEKRHSFESGEKNPQYGKPANKSSGASVTGTYKNYYFRSLLEYFTIKHLENNNIPFLCNDVAIEEFEGKLVIPYVSTDGKNRNYIPDFIVNETEVWEVKSEYALSTEEVKNKIIYAKEYINKSNRFSSLRIITEKDLVIDTDELLEDVINGKVKIDKGKIKKFYKRIGKTNESYLKKKVGQVGNSL